MSDCHESPDSHVSPAGSAAHCVEEANPEGAAGGGVKFVAVQSTGAIG
jgi:hypothetical protein